MRAARLLPSLRHECFDIRRPSSNFDFIERHFGSESEPEEYTSIRRLFSLSRTFNGRTVVIEDLQADGVIASENEEIRELFSDYTMAGLKRVSFWRSLFKTVKGLSYRTSKDLIGYAILKKDEIPSRDVARWHVFESVFCQCPHEYTCVPKSRRFRVDVAGRRFSVKGVLYCQQNVLNKSCAQVALRSLLLHVLPVSDISYAQINQIAQEAFEPAPGVKSFVPSEGLQPAQMTAVLDSFGVAHTDVNYAADPDYRLTLPYQTLLYSGIESGSGALLGFSLSDDRKHVIPMFGHTFNKDTWRNYADKIYFKPGLLKYIPSDSWLGSFVAHDDNFGPNFCVPRLHVESDHVGFVSVLHPDGFLYPGFVAEAIATMYLDSLLSDLNETGIWFRRLLWYAENQRLILRTVAIGRTEYVAHLRRMRDWQKRREAKVVPDALQDLLPDRLWMVEVSIPDVFPANRRKLGEVLLDATVRPTLKLVDYETFVLARLPGTYAFYNPTKNKKSRFQPFVSNLKNHTAVY